MDDDDLRDDLVKLLAARHEEDAWEEEALRRHERTNDLLVEILRGILDRLDVLEGRLGKMPD
jgi:hypothetical protein